jgi:GT2 family glycosyltransferase
MDGASWRAEQRSMRDVLGSRRDSAPAPELLRAEIAGARPLVSVIVVCWNAERLLGRCLEHLIAQSYARREIIVVDDGSEDGTLAVAERAREHAELTIVHRARNHGCPSARNLGLDAASGEIVAFMDADAFPARDWLSRLVAALGSDPGVGGVASTVFYDDNPLVINGAGGTVNRQGWAADLGMNESYEHARIPTEALYPMGCGMAFRRAAIQRVGRFDEQMLNYYDDVDYGIRVWRAGYRVLVASHAWVDHDFKEGGEAGRKALLCERHRMRVVLKHAPARALPRWLREEVRALRLAPAHRRALKLRALGWNLVRLPGVLAGRCRDRRLPPAPQHLLEDSWGDGFPAGVAIRSRPRPETAAAHLDMSEGASEHQLLYGWFPAEQLGGRSRRWSAERAGIVVRLPALVRRLRLDFNHVPADNGGVHVGVRRLGGSDPLALAYETRLDWRYIARSVENHPVALPAGDYEVLFGVSSGFSEPPAEVRSLGLALARLSFEAEWELEPDLQMGRDGVEEQLVSGWYEPESAPGGDYRWAGASAAAAVRLSEPAAGALLRYRLPPVSGGAEMTLSPLGHAGAAQAISLTAEDFEWHERSFPLALGPGDYLVSFEAAKPWSNPDGRDPRLWAENRVLGVALASLSFEMVR